MYCCLALSISLMLFKETQTFLKSVQVAGNIFIIFLISMFTLDQECYDIVTVKEKKTTTIISATNRYVLLCS